MLKAIYNRFNLFFRLLDPVINLRQLVLSIPGYFSYFRDLHRFRRQAKIKPKGKDVFPCLFDNTKKTGFDRHYIYHPAWAARILAQLKPAEHIDISSTLYFCTLVSAFIPVKFYDYRPAKLQINNLLSERADLLKLPFENESILSLSCMHTIEHIGLGRYGDPINPDGDKKACMELTRVLAKEGNLLFVVPVGKPRIMFNAHRIYSFEQVINMFIELKLIEFSLVPDDKDKGFIKNADPLIVDQQNYGCGCFWFRKQ
jgi:hypothetical protein